jgi:hypothetical protein
MNSFNDRMSAQRAILRLVNSHHWPREELHGLSSKTIDRWVLANGLDVRSRIVAAVVTASDKLFFLANKSQEHVTDQYRAVSKELALLAGQIEEEVARMPSN